MGNLFLAWLFLAATFAEASPGALFQYGQSGSFWGYYEDLDRDSISAARAQQILDDVRSNYELAVGRVSFYSYVPQGDPEAPKWPTRFDFKIEAEGASTIAARGELSDEVRMARIAGALFRGSFRGNPVENLSVDFGFAFGAGSQAQVAMRQAAGGAFTRAEAHGTTLAAGLDLKLQHILRLGSTRLVTSAETEETYFKTINERYEGIVNWKLRSFSHDWKGRADFMFSYFNLHGIFAVHPYPTSILPRFWNRLAEASDSARPMRAFLGLGGGVTFFLGPDVQVAGLGGYYGGAPGGELRFRFARAVTARFSSYGIENSSAYQSFNQRLFAGTLDFAL